MSERVAVRVHAADPILEAGVAAELRGWREVELVSVGRRVDVAVVVADAVDDQTVHTIRDLARGHTRGVVLLAAAVDDRQLLAVVEAGVNALLWRREATPDALLSALRA